VGKIEYGELSVLVTEAIKKATNYADEIGMDDPLESIGLNSMHFIQLVIEFEDKYGIVIEDDLLLFENFSTISKFTQSILSHVHKRNEASRSG